MTLCQLWLPFKYERFPVVNFFLQRDVTLCNTCVYPMLQLQFCFDLLVLYIGCICLRVTRRAFMFLLSFCVKVGFGFVWTEQDSGTDGVWVWVFFPVIWKDALQ